MHVMCQVMNWLGMKLGLYFRSPYHCSPALTTLHLSEIIMHDRNTGKSVNFFSKCVNLKNITLKTFDI